MAIDRGPWNALVDDDGSNLTGTVWNKDKIKTVILDPTDAAIAGVGSPVWTMIEANGPATSLPDWNPAPGIVGNTIIDVSLTTGSTIYGFKPAAAPYIGQRIIVHNISNPSYGLTFYHEHGSASVNCMLRCRQSPSVVINGYWAFASFQFSVHGGVGAWVMDAYGPGIGGTLLDALDQGLPQPAGGTMNREGQP